MFGTSNQSTTSGFPLSAAGNTNPIQGGSLTGSNLTFGNQSTKFI